MKLISAKNRLKEIRRSSQYKKWRNIILERDKYSCQLCGSKKDIEVDHIKSLALNPNLAIDIDNGRVLCKECHKKTDTYGVFSKFKNSCEIHPMLKGDFLFKIQSLPTMVSINGKDIGLSVVYLVANKKWRAGYKFARINLSCYGDTIEEAVDNIFDKLKYSIK